MIVTCTVDAHPELHLILFLRVILEFFINFRMDNKADKHSNLLTNHCTIDDYTRDGGEELFTKIVRITNT